MEKALLHVTNLSTSFFTPVGEVAAVRDVSFSLVQGEALALVGESGCGKTVTALSLLRLVPEPGHITRGEIWFNGGNLLALPEGRMEQIRGKEISMVFQDPMTSLNPVLTIGRQMFEILERHKRLRGSAAKNKAIEMLKVVGIPDAPNRLRQYPHEFSGGMRQRVMIAMALSCDPKMLILDEPTTALDVTIQSQIIDLVMKLKTEFGTAVILITHDLGVVAGLAERVAVMYAGRIVEVGSAVDIYHDPRHPYTRGLLKSVPRLDSKEKKRLVPIQGQPPDLLGDLKGCAFGSRCPHVMRICLLETPRATLVGEQHEVCCWLLQAHAPERLGASSGGEA